MARWIDWLHRALLLIYIMKTISLWGTDTVLIKTCVLKYYETTFIFQGYGLKKGGQKSSSNPKIVEPLEGIYIQQVSCGLGHTLYIARDEENDRALLDKLPVYDPDKVRYFDKPGKHMILQLQGFYVKSVEWLVIDARMWQKREGVSDPLKLRKFDDFKTTWQGTM